MKKSLITSLAAILLLSATTAMAQQKMDGMKCVNCCCHRHAKAEGNCE